MSDLLHYASHRELIMLAAIPVLAAGIVAAVIWAVTRGAE